MCSSICFDNDVRLSENIFFSAEKERSITAWVGGMRAIVSNFENFKKFIFALSPIFYRRIYNFF